VPELKASGGQVVGSTATACRAYSGTVAAKVTDAALCATIA